MKKASRMNLATRETEATGLACNYSRVVDISRIDMTLVGMAKSETLKH
jgi:hypothetical protein